MPSVRVSAGVGLCAEAGEPFDDSLIAAEAARHIDQLKAKVDRDDDDSPRPVDRER